MILDKIRKAVLALLPILMFAAFTKAQSWTRLTNQPTFQTDTALLLTDGTVMMHQYNSNNWWRLTPDTTGSYVNGTWTQLASMQSGYAPLYFASAVMIDGRVLVEGGEYNKLSQVETNQGAIYNPTTNTWATVNPPSGWSTIGDSPSVILPDGTFMMGQGGQPSEKQVTFNAATLTWTAVGSGKADGFSEEGLALLPNGTVLTVDTEDGTNSEIYTPSTARWTSAGSTIVTLPNSGGLGIVPEMGPLMQRPNGTVVAFGATTNTSIYNIATGKWTAGPTFPNNDDMADAPAALLPDGNVLVYTSPGVFSGTGTFYEFNGTSFVSAPSTATSGSAQSYQGRLLLLPTGQVLYALANGQNIDVEVYTPGGTYQSAWQPTITSLATTLTAGSANNVVSGTQFNGFSQGTMYGDDSQMATNYPLVRITNNSTHHVFYTRTHNHSTMGIATGSATVSTQFDVPGNIELGQSSLVVVANGIPSNPMTVSIEAAAGFTYTGSLHAGRVAPTATLLNSGKVLIAGGDTASSSSELYDSSTGTFSTTGGLNNSNARWFHSSSLLANGSVLVAGGWDGTTNPPAAELYSPATGAFTVTGSLNTPRQNHTGNYLNNGEVLISGGFDANSVILASAELYNPSTGAFAYTGSMHAARTQHSSVALNSGSILVVGGVGAGVLKSAELYNPSTGAFTTTGSMHSARYNFTATLLSNGMVLVVGGFDNVNVLGSAELYNPSTGTFSTTGSLITARQVHTATLLSDGMVLITGGADVNGNVLSSAELYNPATGTFTATGSMNSTRVDHTATLLGNGTVLVVGGYDNNLDFLATAELYQ